MSCYMVSEGHVRYLVQACLDRRISHSGLSFHHEGRRWQVRDEDMEDEAATLLGILTPTTAGRELWEENVKSVRARYDDADKSGMIEEGWETFQFTWTASRTGAPDPVQVMKSCDCYSYQSCEHEGWDTSLAHALIRELRRSASQAVDGYEDATWGAPGEFEPQRA